MTSTRIGDKASELEVINRETETERTPLNGFENGGFERLRKSGVKGACLLALAVDCLEIV
jgi:hypothetical protein